MTDFPETEDYMEGRVWVRWISPNEAVVGLTDLALEEIGTVQAVRPIGLDEYFSEDDLWFEVIGSGCNLEVLADRSGKVTDVNNLVKDEPEMVKDDPLGEGWIIRFESVEEE